MKLHFFTVPAQYPEDMQQVLNVFCAQHRVLTIEKHFVDLGEASFWSICVTIIEGDPQNPLKASSAKRTAIDYREVLSEQAFSIYIKLRELRKNLAAQEGIPVYALFSNEQLAEMVTRPVTTLTELAQIAGIGKARIEKYGHVFVSVLQASLAEQQKVAEPPSADETSPR